MLTALTVVLSLATREQAAAQNPVSYGEMRKLSHVAEFDFAESGRRVVLYKPMSFYAPQPVTLQFDILVKPDGTVKYVRSGQCPKEQMDFKRGGTSALYGYAFEPVDSSFGEQWLKVEMRVGH